MKYFWSIALCLFIGLQAGAQFRDSLSINEPPSFAEIWLPGGTHFHEGNTGKGLVFATLETGLFASAILFNDELKAGNKSEYYNYPFLLGQQLYVIDKGDYALRSLKNVLDMQTEFRYDIPSLNEMLTAPFRPRVLKEPVVWGVVGLAVLENVLVYAFTDNIRPLSEVSRVHGWGGSFNPEWGSTTYGATGAAISWGAGVSEEMMFRGYLQPLLHYRFGRQAGLWGSSLLFTAGHLPSFLKIKDPLMLAWSVSQITALSYLFGLNAMKNDYDIQPVIAAHAWYNTAIMFTSWALDPENNPLGFRVSFAIK